jgi:hypothetical protein
MDSGLGWTDIRKIAEATVSAVAFYVVDNLAVDILSG